MGNIDIDLLSVPHDRAIAINIIVFFPLAAQAEAACQQGKTQQRQRE